MNPFPSYVSAMDFANALHSLFLLGQQTSFRWGNAPERARSIARPTIQKEARQFAHLQAQEDAYIALWNRFWDGFNQGLNPQAHA